MLAVIFKAGKTYAEITDALTITQAITQAGIEAAKATVQAMAVVRADADTGPRS